VSQPSKVAALQSAVTSHVGLATKTSPLVFRGDARSRATILGVIAFRLNGELVTLRDAPSHTTLLECLRARGLTGAKEGCAEGECGACAVAIVAPHDRGSAYRVINSCLMLLPMAAGREIYTVEGLACDGTLTDAQQAMAAAGGSQCGYCTPGFVMSLFAEQHRPDRVGPCDPLALAGNLCRCTGYRPIRDAAQSLGPPPAGPLRDRLAQSAPPLGAIHIDDFSRPSSLAETLEILETNPGAKIVAGATDVGVESNLRHRRWPHLVSLDAIEELRTCGESGDEVRIGAALPLSDIPSRWPGAPAVVHEWLALFASPLIRNRATLGGNLATASPIGDSAPLLLALDARVEIAGRQGSRVVPLDRFFTGYRQTALQPAEAIAAIRIPKPWPSRLAFYKVAKRRLDDISTVAAAMALDCDARGRVTRARFAFGGVAATPLLVAAAEDAILGEIWNERAAARVGDVLDRTLAPLSDHRGTSAYRRAVSRSLVEKFWWEHRS
jgi:xanthine dehydrogenase small subunit